MDAIRPDARASIDRALTLEDEEPVGAGEFTLPRPGDVVGGKYRIEKVIGKGGMGVVYAAHHLVLDQRVALKLLLVESSRGNETVERFLREAQAAASLRSEHVVRVMDAGALDSGLPFLAMEYLEGCDLAELLSLEGALPLTDIADYMLQALAALAQAHAAGIIHRDLKPANLFLAVCADKSNILKVLDFGISKQKADRSHWKDLTGQAVLGTPVYMSPEQLRSSKGVDPRADIWSLGIVMYELLTRKVPFDGDGPGEVFAAVLEKRPESVRVHRPDLPVEWERVVMRCLLRAPQARYQDVGELARALTPLASGRWAHLTAAIAHALARPAASLPKEGIALVAAAVAAAHASMPPPGMGSGKITAIGREMPALGAGALADIQITADALSDIKVTADKATLGPPAPATVSDPSGSKGPVAADKGLFVGVVPVRGRAFGRGLSRGPLAVVAGALLLGGIAIASRSTSRTAASLTPMAGHAAQEVAPRATESPAAVDSARVDVGAEPAASSTVTESASAGPVADPGSARAESPAPRSPGRHPAPAPAKHSPAVARPTFLKSWR